MKKLVLMLATIVATTTCALAQQTTNTETVTAANADAGKMTFPEQSFSFGDVPEGPDVQHDFTFTNTGKKPINIKHAGAGCGCTVANWPHEPVLPGQTATIKVTFHTASRPGAFSKTVFIDSDADQPTYQLVINGTVKPTGAASAQK